MTRSSFTTQHQKTKTAVCKTKTTARETKTDFLVLDRSCPQTDGLSLVQYPHFKKWPGYAHPLKLRLWRFYMGVRGAHEQISA